MFHTKGNAYIYMPSKVRRSSMSQDIFSKEKKAEINYTMNNYTVKCLKVIFLVILIIWGLNLLNIFVINQRIMATGFIMACLVIMFTILMTKFLDLRKEWVKYFLITCVTIVITILGIYLTYHTLLLYALPMMIAAQYTDRKMLIYTYVLTVLGIFCGAMGEFFWGLCDANMLFLTTESTEYYLNKASKSLQFDGINVNEWYTIPMYYVLPRSILITLLIPVITSISKNIRNYEEYAIKMEKRGEKDDMTGLKNRNKFLRMIDEEYPDMDKVGVVFFDVNNLKWVNDNLGHDKGDVLIATVGRMILAMEDTNKKAYRIGGDEFVMVIENPKEMEIETLLDQWEELLEMKSRTSELDFMVAYGYAYGDGKDIKGLVKIADERMYKTKQKQKEVE